jgi:transcriptional regulator
MYNLPDFKENNPAVVKQFMRDNPFVMLIGCDGSHTPVATQVPVFLEERDEQLFLSGHIQRNTDHHKAMEQNNRVLAVFTGPHTYVSASWYSNPQVASTWNYMSVHAKGTIRFLTEVALLELLKKTTSHFENNPHSTALVEKMPPAYLQKQLKAIIAFEIAIDKLDHVFKLSQNRDKESYENVIHELEQQDSDSKKIAEEMRQRTTQLFK